MPGGATFGATRWRGTVPFTGTPRGLLLVPGWFLVVICPVMLAVVILALAIQHQPVHLLLIPPLAIGGLAGWRLVHVGIVVTPDGVALHGFASTRWIAAGDVVEVDIERRRMSTFEAWTSPYLERYAAKLLLSDGERVSSPALVGGVKRRQWNNIAPDLDLLEWRAHRISEILNLPNPPPRISRHRAGRVVTSRPWPPKRPQAWAPPSAVIVADIAASQITRSAPRPPGLNS